MIRLFKDNDAELDSFERATQDFVSFYGAKFLLGVHEGDLDEVAVAFVRQALPYLREYACNFTIVPLSKRNDAHKFYHSPANVKMFIKAQSGRTYFAGFGYGD